MATRLFPMSNDHVVIERLAGVRAGTTAKLNGIYAATKHDREGGELYAALAEAVNADAQRLHHFKVYGWGRMKANVTPYGLDQVRGSTNDTQQVLGILKAQGLSDDEAIAAELICSGLCWW